MKQEETGRNRNSGRKKHQKQQRKKLDHTDINRKKQEETGRKGRNSKKP